VCSGILIFHLLTLKMSSVFKDYLSALSADSAGELDVLGHDGDALGVDGAQVGVLEKADQVGLGSFLKSADGGRLETQIGLEVLSDFSHQTLERQLADEELGRLLVTSDLTESDGTGAVSVGLLDATGRGGRLPGGLGGELLAGGFATGGLTGGLLGTGHLVLSKFLNFLTSKTKFEK
jgi:hypothetical protein